MKEDNNDVKPTADSTPQESAPGQRGKASATAGRKKQADQNAFCLEALAKGLWTCYPNVHGLARPGMPRQVSGWWGTVVLQQTHKSPHGNEARRWQRKVLEKLPRDPALAQYMIVSKLIEDEHGNEPSNLVIAVRAACFAPPDSKHKAMQKRASDPGFKPKVPATMHAFATYRLGEFPDMPGHLAEVTLLFCYEPATPFKRP